MIKASDMIIGLLVVSLIAAVFGIAMADFSDRYSVEYDNSSMAVYDQLQNLSEISNDMADKESDTQTGTEDEENPDILGTIFDSGYQVLRITKKSFGVYGAMTDQGLEDANLGEATYSIKLFLSAIMVILLILGVIVSAIAKWYL